MQDADLDEKGFGRDIYLDQSQAGRAACDIGKQRPRSVKVNNAIKQKVAQRKKKAAIHKKIAFSSACVNKPAHNSQPFIRRKDTC
jgi:hypothetical protein